jgi:pimeloyl-ACP methyl ester carboxylesterase
MKATIRSRANSVALLPAMRWHGWLLFALVLLAACQGVNGNNESVRSWRAPDLKRVRSPVDIERQIQPLIGNVKQPKVIFIGVYGGNPPPWENAAWFDPQLWPAYRVVDLNNETELNRIAYHDSLMHVIALHVGKLFPSSLTLMIQGDSNVVSDIIDLIYARGDRLFLVGHSFGGRVIGEVAQDLSKKSIPVEMVAYIESFWSSSVIPANVRQAFNFYVPVSFAVCPGLNAIKAEDERATSVINIAIPDPIGPYSGFCAEHRNIDSEPRAWKPLVEYLKSQAAPATR